MEKPRVIVDIVNASLGLRFIPVIDARSCFGKGDASSTTSLQADRPSYRDTLGHCITRAAEEPSSRSSGHGPALPLPHSRRTAVNVDMARERDNNEGQARVNNTSSTPMNHMHRPLDLFGLIITARCIFTMGGPGRSSSRVQASLQYRFTAHLWRFLQGGESAPRR